jgi:hypothetical protein
VRYRSRPDRRRIHFSDVADARARTARGIEYSFGAKDDGWQLVFKPKFLAHAKYYLNGQPVTPTSRGIRMSGKKNLVVVVSSDE